MFHGKKFLQPGTASTTNATTRAIGRPCLAGTQTQQQDHTLPTAGSSSSSAVHSERNSQLARLRQLQQLYQRLAVLSAIKSEKVEGKNDKNDATSYRFNFTSNHLPTFHGEKVLQLGRAFPASTSNASFLADIEKAAMMYRNAAGKASETSDAVYHWSGKLPVRARRTMTFSRKVFLGGIPWDSTSEELVRIFSRFGSVTICWPQKDAMQSSNTNTEPSTTKGYCYLIFDHEVSVSQLLAKCAHNSATGGDFYKISSPKFPSKDVQVIPWVISDSCYTKSTSIVMNMELVVFVGALHALITAEMLANIMNDLFGNVVFAALDTDKYKYPIGSGSVAFSSQESYMKAIAANFVDIRTPKFVKTIQIDPYLQHSLCDHCYGNPGIYFCRAFECFSYFCPRCWQLMHNRKEMLKSHKPVRRTFKSNNDHILSTTMTLSRC
ncbi:unnamed protein product [Heterobilharzia americana]|nr:unnamed protein product [Heterobilharzia americana]